MPYKSYSEQVCEHVLFLRSKGFDIAELQVNADFVRCHQAKSCQYRGELAYKTQATKLNNGLIGVQTWYRGLQGETSNFQTYGLGPSVSDEIKFQKTSVEVMQNTAIAKHEVAGRKAYGFWQYSTVNGRSEYLERKKVGSYGIRFRSSAEYGDVAVIPMVDSTGRLWNYQLLNSDGSKRQPKDARTEGLFHAIGNLVDGQSVGIAESYVTSASCFELTGVSTACAFSCQNLKNIARILRQRCPNSRLIIFADNDRHLEMRGVANQGLVKGQEVTDVIEGEVAMVSPDFEDLDACSGLSDWNDLINHKGFEYARIQIAEHLKKTTTTQSTL